MPLRFRKSSVCCDLLHAVPRSLLLRARLYEEVLLNVFKALDAYARAIINGCK